MDKLIVINFLTNLCFREAMVSSPPCLPPPPRCWLPTSAKKDVMAISTFKKLNEAFNTLHSNISTKEEISLTKKEKATTLNKNRLQEKIMTGNYKPMTGMRWSGVSEQAKELVCKLVVVDPGLSAEQILQPAGLRWI